MKFVLTTKHFYWWPVTVAVPHPDQKRAGEMLEMTFKLQFESLPRDEAKALYEQARALPAAEAEAQSHADLLRVVKDWDEDVVDDAGRPVPFSAEALQQLLQISWYRLGVYRAWAASQVGEAARRGN
jgi:hypothetical protein